MSSTLSPYSFPDPAKLAAVEAAAKPAQREADDAILREAIDRGYSDGFARGEAAAELASKDTIELARSQGFAAGQKAGFEQAAQAAEALRQALVQFANFRSELLAQAESFCVDLSLAMAARLVEINQLRADFIRQTIRAAIRTLAPEPPRIIFVNPADLKSAASAFTDLPIRPDDSIPPGSARVEAGRLMAEGGMERALEQLKASVFETRARRTKKPEC